MKMLALLRGRYVLGMNHLRGDKQHGTTDDFIIKTSHIEPDVVGEGTMQKAYLS